ncbi:hypothetical protein [Halomonas sp.]|uniref:hypothetical protein n=1 Tax=Halomonas sp. TaxID=1486246 RepID=UPI000C8F467A|nr:hypothetical protein [Halomonas sp.]MAR71221.1 hypothetical protein [Halomonas sp.]MBR9879633.1 hypothetical protein [Gammaproteobacteria bacterium]|tara:strand:- start:6601 stop:7077 length:477 start_codon:yes stop_codon:yes gene_type:complete
MSGEDKLSERGAATTQRLESALKRLIEGKPERTPNDGKLNLSRINKEAGLSSGGVYYYVEFVERARKIINENKAKDAASLSASKKLSIEKLRAQRDKERELKAHYRSQRDDMKKFCDHVVARHANLEFSLYEALERIDALEAELKKITVVKLDRGKES